MEPRLRVFFKFFNLLRSIILLFPSSTSTLFSSVSPTDSPSSIIPPNERWDGCSLEDSVLIPGDGLLLYKGRPLPLPVPLPPRPLPAADDDDGEGVEVLDSPNDLLFFPPPPPPPPPSPPTRRWLGR